ncbi:winged helix DNA-binding domain-containing protein [Chondromyces apiculatus]|uniref:Winged helix DNA-binding domain-containing protein n=1 Tax=Chondromyces apiculatus DSM 436 TaxID=1192034 RepID=A0A017T094_9BACT|nr:winged helix DNA-binding domain-containing protein [Chondromyces apiculatus]EYF02659.1 Hypothetical protein CAP_6689 [Chondromyces apiculatus DSM 436]
MPAKTRTTKATRAPATTSTKPRATKTAKAPATTSAKGTALSLRALNRATLARQMLLQREKVTPAAAVERLAGLQAQLARPPYLALWSRLEGFQREQLSRAIADRTLVRGTLMRATLHLVSARDYRRFRLGFQPLLTQGMQGVLRERATALDIDRLVAEAQAFFEEQPRTFEDLRDHLVGLFPGGDERAMGFAVRMHLPLVMVPTDDTWGYPANADFAVATSWLGGPLDTGDASQALVRSYLGAFGPATVADMQSWSGLKGLRAVVEAMRPELLVLVDERGKELFDLPDAPRPAEDTPAPPRFLPDFDALILGHADRTRIIADEHRPLVSKATNLRILPTFLLDGRVAGTWSVARKRKTATLTLEPFRALAKAERSALDEEGQALLRFAEPDASAFEIDVAK